MAKVAALSMEGGMRVALICQEQVSKRVSRSSIPVHHDREPGTVRTS